MGGRIKAGEYGWPVIFWKFLERKDREAEADGDEGNTMKKIPLLRYYRCWNLDQVTGITDPDTGGEQPTHWEAIEAANQVIASLPQPPSIQHGKG